MIGTVTRVARGRRAFATLVVGGLLLGGCTGATQAVDPAPLVAEPVISAEQAAEIADGAVAITEYEAAYRRYLGCMSQAGIEVVETGKDRTVYEFAVPESGSDADAICYAREFEQVDIAWQIAHQDESESTDHLRACLRRHGVDPAATVDEIVVQMEAAGISPGDCV